MTKHTLIAQPRTITGRAVKKLRVQGLVPANIFSKSIDSQNIQLSPRDFVRLRREIGESTLIYLEVAGEKTDRPVIVREVTTHPVTDQLLHIAFNQVSLKEKVTAPVSLEVTGTAPAEKDGLGILVQHLQVLDIEALPADIPEHILVDVSGLSQVDAAIAVKNLQIDTSKITIKTDPETIVVKIEPLAAEEKVEAPAPVEGAVTAEGAAPAPAEGAAPAPAAEAKPEAQDKKE